MQTPIRTQRPRTARSMCREPAVHHAMTTRRAAATSMRTAPMTSAFVPVVATSTVVTDPVVPQETAARPISASPRSRAGLDGADTARDDSAFKGDFYEHRVHRDRDHGAADARQPAQEELLG